MTLKFQNEKSLWGEIREDYCVNTIYSFFIHKMKLFSLILLLGATLWSLEVEIAHVELKANLNRRRFRKSNFSAKY